jgi:hypothetical protein
MSEKKYKAIVKVSNEKFVKYHLNNLVSFARFLDEKFPDWRFFNVFDRTGQQVKSYTKNNRPQSKTL